MKSNFSKGLLMTALITGSVMWGGTNVFAEELQEYTLDQMVVTATRTEKAILDTPASVDVVTAKDIEKSGAVKIDDVLKRVPGVSVSRSGGLATSSPMVAMRGLKNNYDTLVLLDGQPIVNAYSGTVNWNDVPVESIEKIEIVKGPASSIYGSNAASGVISITTKKAKGLHGSSALTYGTNHTWIKKINIGDKFNKFGYDLYYTATDSHTYGYEAYKTISTDKTPGVPTGDNYVIESNTTGSGKVVKIGKKGDKIWNEDNYSGKFTWDFDRDKTLSLGFFKNKSKYSYDYRSHENWIGEPGKYYVDGNHSFTFRNSDFDTAPGAVDERIYTIGYKDDANGWSVNAGLTDNRSWNGGVYTTDKSALSDYNSKRYNLSVNKEITLTDKDTAVTGFQYVHDKMDKVKFATDFKTKLQTGGGKSDTYGVYFQNEHKFNEKLSLIGAIRYDHWTVKDGYVTDGNGYNSAPESRSDSAVSPKIALNYKFDDSQSSYISWGKAFSAPTLYNMFSGSTNSDTSQMKVVIPNPSLKPQIISTIETGWKKNFNDKTFLEVALFYNKIKDINYKADLGKQTIDGTEYTVQQNLSGGRGENKGIEIGLNHKFDDKLSAFTNLTLQNPVIKEAQKKGEIGKLVTQTSKRLFNIGFDYSDGKFSADLAGNYYSKKYSYTTNSDVVTGVPGAYDPVFLVSLNTTYRFNKNHSVNLLINNLLDRDYYNYYNGQGRNFLLTYSYNF